MLVIRLLRSCIFFQINILEISQCIYGFFTLVIGLLRYVYFFLN